jgi:hypothetical protein
MRDFYMLGLLSILESVSNTVKAGGFLRVQKRSIVAKTVRPVFLYRVETMIKDVERFNTESKGGKAVASAELSDSRDLSGSRLFDAIITSPP